MRKHAIFALGGVLVFSLVSAALAQAPAGPPQPGPEHQKLAYFAGTWSSEGEMKASEMGPTGKFTFTETCEWFAGNFALICHSDGKIGEGTVKGLSVMSYDMAQKNYIYFETNSFGENVVSHGKVEGDTWTWENQSTINGKLMRTRFTLKQLSADSASYTFEMGTGDQPLQLIMEGKQTRQK
jgi:Protein of unknown function (DUF1579)